MKQLKKCFLCIIALALLNSCGNKADTAQKLFPLMAPESKHWGTAELLETDNTDDAASPDIAMNDAGDAVVVWDQGDGVEYNINVRHYHRDTGAWDEPALIEHNDWGDHNNSHAPRIAIAPSGNAISVWQQHDGSRWHIWGNEYNAGTGLWGTEHSIETSFYHSWSHDISMDGNGNALVVWNQSIDMATTRYDILFNRCDAASASWDTSTPIEADTINTQIPLIHLNKDGWGVATWQNFSVAGTWVNIYCPTIKTWGTPAGLLPAGNVLAMTSDSSGNFIILVDISGYLNVIKYAIATGTWSSPEPIGSQMGTHSSASIFADRSGNISVVWRFSSDGANFDLLFARYTASSASWGMIQNVEQETGNPGTIDAVLDRRGNILMLWSQDVGGTSAVLFSRYNKSARSLEAAQPIQSLMESAYLTKIVCDPQGNAIAIWLQHDGIRSNLWYNRYE